MNKFNSSPITHPVSRPACPVACKYCSVAEVSYRRKQWEGKSVSINKVVTVLNKSSADWPDPEYFTSDVLGFEASSDPFWINRFNDFKVFCNNYAPVSRIITFVTKMPITKKHLDVIRNLDVPVAIVVSITGLDEYGIEKTSRSVLYDNIKKCQDNNIPVIPIIHPYIHGLADIDKLLDEFKSIGIKYFQIKGFRFDRSMTWLPKDVYEFYKDKEGIEYMPDIHSSLITHHSSLTRMELRDFYKMHWLPPKIDYQKAKEYVEKIVESAIITSSATNEEVIEYAIRRRCET
jgi:DNA repair photolyase